MAKEIVDEKMKEKLALAKRDIEIFTLEKTLEPYSSGAYDIKIREQQMQWLLRQDVMSNFAKGCILLEVKERENLQTFANFIENSCGGMSQRSAYYYMTYAKKCVELKKLKEFGEKNWSKLVALLHSCTDEELKEIEEKGIKGKALSEFDNYSVRDFKLALKKYKDEFDKTLKEETRNITLELNNTLEEIEVLRAQLKQPETDEEFEKAWRVAEKHFDETCRLFRNINLERVVGGDTHFRHKYARRIDTMKNEMESLYGIMLDAIR